MEDNLIGLDLLVNNKKIKKQKKDNIFEKENKNFNESLNKVDLNFQIKEDILKYIKKYMSESDISFMEEKNIVIDKIINESIKNLIELIRLKYTILNKN